MRTLLSAVRRGAECKEISGVEVQVRHAFDAGVDDVLRADGVILGTTENLAYMSGAMKDFFDRTYYGVIGRKEGMPCAAFIRAGSDGTGAARGIEPIVTGLRWRATQPPLILKGSFQSSFKDDCETLGTRMAAGLEAGIF